ncbi:hypothetical protein TWF718_010924 [Orbilia javanica]|uniref:F-box domain-containing protein n=1 Tax=Orbilia javanica TaxID=47235 RepID=A0AAN8NN39_9PEZI
MGQTIWLPVSSANSKDPTVRCWVAYRDLERTWQAFRTNFKMASVGSRRSQQCWDSLVQSINEPLFSDKGRFSKASGLINQDIGRYRKSNATFAKTFGLLPGNIGYGAGPGPFISPLVSRIGLSSGKANVIPQGPAYSFQINTGPPNCLGPIRYLGGTGPRIPEELAFTILQGPLTTRKCTLYHKLAINWYHGNACQNSGQVSRSPRLSLKGNFSNFLHQSAKICKSRSSNHGSRRPIGSRPGYKDPSSILLKPELWKLLPASLSFCADSDPAGMNPDKSAQRGEDSQKKGSRNEDGHVRRPRGSEQKRKRAADENEENEDADPPPSKRIDRKSPGPQALQLALACPFAKGDLDRNEHACCLFIRRKNLSGIKEHLKRNHFENKLPNAIREAQTWEDLFDICNPHWHPTERPSPYIETISRRSVAGSSKSSASSVKSNQWEDCSTSTPLDCQKIQNGPELHSPLFDPRNDNGLPRTTNQDTPTNTHTGRHHHYNIGPLSPTSYRRSSNQESFPELEEEEEIVNPPNHLWLEQRIPLGPSHTSNLNLNATQSVPAQAYGQQGFFQSELGVEHHNLEEGIQSAAPPSIDNSRKPFEDPPHLEYQNFFDLESYEKDSAPWSGNNPVVQATGPFQHASMSSTLFLNKNKKSLQPSLTIGQPLDQQEPKSKPRGDLAKSTKSSNRACDRPKRKRYLLLVKRIPRNPLSQESKSPHRFNFEDFDEFHAKFESWLQHVFTDPPFSWENMMLFDDKEKTELESVEEVAGNLEHSFIHYRSDDAALYLVSRNGHSGLANSSFNPQAVAVVSGGGTKPKTPTDSLDSNQDVDPSGVVKHLVRKQILALLISQSVTADKPIFCWRDSGKLSHVENSEGQLQPRPHKHHSITERRGPGTNSNDSGREGELYPKVTSASEDLPLQAGAIVPSTSYPSTIMNNKGAKNPESSAQQGQGSSAEPQNLDPGSASGICKLLLLPSEILHQILLYLPAISLYAISLTCHSLQTHSFADALWENIVDSPDLPSPHPYLSYRSLHHALAPHLYLKRKIFIGDRQYFGSILVSKYMPISGTLEAFSFTGTYSSDPAEFSTWSYNPDVIICPFSPEVNIREEPELKISPNSKASADGEIPVSRRGILATFFRAEAILQRDVYSQMAVWPPMTIPAETRVRNESPSGFKNGANSKQIGPFIRLPSNISINGTFVSVGGVNDVMGAAVDRSAFIVQQSKATPNESAKWKADELRQRSGYPSETAFRLRRWAVLGDTSGDLENRFRMGERVETFAELDEELWTPTPEYPYRGIWAGDYGPHGTEFLLFHQPKTSSPRKRLEIVKLTGDPNVPRGEYTLIVDDLSQPLRIADEEEIEWPGAKVYHARGRVAAQEFRNDKFIDVHLIIPEPEKDWQSAQAGKRESLSEKASGDDERERKDNIGEEWGVGSRERGGLGGRSKRLSNTKQPARLLDQPWVPMRVAAYWHGAGEIIRLYRRVNVHKFLN